MSRTPGLPPARGRSGPVVVAVTLAASLLVAAGVFFTAKQQSAEAERAGETAAASAAAEIASIVALPATVFAPDEQAYLADAIPDTLSSQLARIDGLVIKTPPTTGQLDRIDGDLGRVAEVYGVDAFVMTSLAVNGEDLLLNVQLVDAQTGDLLWSLEYEGDRSGYLPLTRRAAEGLRVALRMETRPLGVRPAGVPGGRDPENSEAELAYQRGAHFLSRYTDLQRPAHFESSRQSLETALQLDPTMARAASRLARLYLVDYEYVDPRPDTLEQIEHWSRRALEIGEYDAGAWSALSFVVRYRDGATAPLDLERALRGVELDPDSAFALNALGVALSWTDWQLAGRAFRRAAELEPFFLCSYANAGFGAYLDGKSANGLAIVEGALAIQSDMPWARRVKMILLLDLNRLDEARELMAGFDKAQRGTVNELLDGMLEAALQLRTNGATAGDPLLSFIRELQDADRGPRYFRSVAGAAAVVAMSRYADTESTLQALSLPDETGLPLPYPWLRDDPTLDSLRDRPEFQSILERARELHEPLRAVLEAAELPPDLRPD
jgi:TolB-like protein/Tfp pilus assembly protein PilF